MRHAIALLAACAALFAAAAVGGCRGGGEEMPVDGHVTAPAPLRR